MNKIENELKRIMIYFFYDRDGIIDEYVHYQIEDLAKNVTDILFVSNGKLKEESKSRIKNKVKFLFERDNIGFDVWAYKEGLEYLGWDKLKKYDEIILMNFTMYGPIYPFSEMFSVMDERKELDFWGITKHHGFHFDPFGTIPYGYIPEHIQSSFISVRHKMHTSEDFIDYWENMGSVNTYGEAVGKHEAIFTKIFTEKGFLSDVYVQTDDLKEYTHYPLMIEPVELLKNRKCPVFKRKSFSNEYYEFLNCTTGEPTIELYEYLEKYTDYDMNMVWDNLLRLENMADLKKRMHLNMVLPRDYALAADVKVPKIALMLHIYFDDLIDECRQYAISMPENCDIYITTHTDELKKEIEKSFCIVKCNKITVTVIENRGRDVSSLLVGHRPYINDYDLVCFAHDKKSKQFKPYTIGKSFYYKCFQNILGSKEYVLNILNAFATEERLGMLMPPPPNHAAYFGLLGTEWGGNYINVVETAKSLGINVNFNEYREPVAPLGTMFWFRPKAMKELVNHNWEYSDFPKEPNNNDGTILHAIERLYGFTVQQNGFYSRWVMHDKFANMELTNLHFMLREVTMNLYDKVGHQMGANVMIQAISTSSMNEDKKEEITRKAALKKIVPDKIWSFIRRIYLFFKGN